MASNRIIKRSEVTQVVNTPYVQPVQDTRMGSLAQLLVLGELGTRLAEDTSRTIEIADQRKTSEARFKAQMEQADKQIFAQRIQNRTEAVQTQNSFLREKLTQINQNIKEMEENEANGALADLARIPDDKLPASAEAMGIRHPDNLRRIDAALGERRAINDLPVLLESFLTDTSKTPKEHLDAWMESPNRVIGSVDQQAAYAAQIAQLVNQEEIRTIRDRTKAGKKVAIENEIFKLQRNAATNKETWSVDPNKINESLNSAYDAITSLDPAFSKLDLASAFGNYVYPQLIKGMSGKEQLALAERLSNDDNLGDMMRAIGPQFSASLIESGREQLYQDQNRAANALQQQLEASNDVPSYSIANALIQRAVAEGDISKSHYDNFKPMLLKKSEDMKSLLKIEGKLNNDPRYDGTAITQADQALYLKRVEQIQAQYLQDNGAPMPLDQSLRMQMNAGVLTNDTKEQIFGMIKAGVVKNADGTLDASNLEQGIKALAFMKQTNPSMYRDQWEGQRDTLEGSTKLAVNLIDAGYSSSQVLGYLSRASSEDLSQGFQAAKAQMSGDAAVSFITKRTDPGYFTWEASREGTSRKAVNLTKSLFAYFYVTSPIQDEKERVKFAKDRTASEISQRFGLQDLGDTRYLIDKQSVPESLRGEGSFFSPPMKELIRYVSRITGDTLYVNGLGELKYEVDAIHYDKDYMYIPSVSTFTNSEGKVFELKVPLAPDKLKAWSKNAPKEAAQQISEWTGKTIAPFRGFSRRGM